MSQAIMEFRVTNLVLEKDSDKKSGQSFLYLLFVCFFIYL